MVDGVKSRALKILGSRNFSEQEMQKRLISKGETPEDAQETVRWLVSLGYINDSNYATLIVNHYLAKGYGERRIKDELFKRGIPREMWDDNLSQLEASDALDSALVYLEKKLRGRNLQCSYDKDDLNRAGTALVRRGFSYDEAKAAINRYMENSIDEDV